MLSSKFPVIFISFSSHETVFLEKKNQFKTKMHVFKSNINSAYYTFDEHFSLIIRQNFIYVYCHSKLYLSRSRKLQKLLLNYFEYHLWLVDKKFLFFRIRLNIPYPTFNTWTYGSIVMILVLVSKLFNFKTYSLCVFFYHLYTYITLKYQIVLESVEK